MMSHRPDFANAEEYIAHVDLVRRKGGRPWPPATRSELIALLDYDPEYAKRFRPCPSVMRHLGLPAQYGREPKPLEEPFKAQLLKTIEIDATFREAFRMALATEDVL